MYSDEPPQTVRLAPSRVQQHSGLRGGYPRVYRRTRSSSSNWQILWLMASPHAGQRRLAIHKNTIISFLIFNSVSGCPHPCFDFREQNGNFLNIAWRRIGFIPLPKKKGWNGAPPSRLDEGKIHEREAGVYNHNVASNISYRRKPGQSSETYFEVVFIRIFE